MLVTKDRSDMMVQYENFNKHALRPSKTKPPFVIGVAEHDVGVVLASVAALGLGIEGAW